MAKRVRDTDLDTRAARSKLRIRGKPYYKVIGQGLHVGYRKGKRAGMWVVRRYAGASTYVVETIAEADDYADADGDKVLTFWQAQDRARSIAGAPARSNGPYKVKDAIADYLVELEGRASYADTRARLEAYALPAHGDKHVDKLTASCSANGIAILLRRREGFGLKVELPSIAPERSIWMIPKRRDVARSLPIASSVC